MMMGFLVWHTSKLARTAISIPVAQPSRFLHDDPSSDRGELWTLWTSSSDPGFLPLLSCVSTFEIFEPRKVVTTRARVLR